MLPLVLYVSFLFLPSLSAGGVWVLYDESAAEYRRVAHPRVESGQWRRLMPGTPPPASALVYAFGARAARTLPAGSARVVEVFVGGRTPLVSGHEILPWEPPVKAVADLTALLRVLHPQRPACILSGPRTRQWAQEAAAAMPPSRVVELNELTDALSFVSRLHADPSACGAVVLAADFDVLDFPVLQALVQLQVRARISLVARTRHEVLLGAAAAVEPYWEDWAFPPSKPVGARVFLNGAIWRFLELPKATLPACWAAAVLGN